MRIPAACPVCGETESWKQINAWHEGFSFWKALAGSCFFGKRIGFWAGFAGKKQRLYHCRACGCTMLYQR